MTDKRDLTPTEQLTAYERWELPSLGEGASTRRARNEPRLRLPTAQELEAVRKAAFDEGFASGREEGRQRGYTEGWQQAREEVTAQATRLGNIIQAYTQPLKDQADLLEQDMLDLTHQLVEAVLEQELRSHIEPLRALVHRALEAVGQRCELLSLQLNPEDAALLREHLLASEAWQPGWRIVENAVLTQGGCVIESPQQYIDARLEARRDAVLASLRVDHDPA
ncbi:MAG: hypothetical protein HKM02_01110 [Pseudomonadales bacterium]|nr:hypothetical protein [Pseudomonadales bacterium]